MLFAEACCGRKAFDVSFRALMAQVLPGVQPMLLRGGHPLFKIPNVVQTMKVTPACAKSFNSPQIPPQVFSWSVEGNPAVIYSPIGMAGAWELSPNKYCNSYLEDDSLKLGVNILMYVSTR